MKKTLLSSLFMVGFMFLGLLAEKQRTAPQHAFKFAHPAFEYSHGTTQMVICLDDIINRDYDLQLYDLFYACKLFVRCFQSYGFSKGRAEFVVDIFMERLKEDGMFIMPLDTFLEQYPNFQISEFNKEGVKRICSSPLEGHEAAVLYRDRDRINEHVRKNEEEHYVLEINLRRMKEILYIVAASSVTCAVLGKGIYYLYQKHQERKQRKEEK